VITYEPAEDSLHEKEGLRRIFSKLLLGENNQGRTASASG
jgi:hypothetical protein